MTDLAVNHKFLSLSSFKDSLIISFDQCEEKVLNRKEEVCNNENPKTEPEDVYDGSVPVVTSAFSHCDKRFVCCAHKSLSVWNVENWTLFGKKTIQRSACKVIFSPKSDCIIVADKSGDVYLHYLSNFEKPGELILGHVSMLLDVLVTPDEKFIITCDRDEKIRVSCYPNAYNINSYCLGHDDFVTSINLIPNQKKLLSAGGDGTLRLWDYENGKELFTYSVKDDMSKIKTDEETLPVVHKVSIVKTDNESSLVCLLIFKTNAVWLYNIDHSSVSLKFSQFIKTDSEPYALQTFINTAKIWFLQLDENEPLKALHSVKGEFKKCEESDSSIQRIVKKHIKILDLNKSHERQISCLCKKKFDNESEYYKRKKERLEAVESKKVRNIIA